MKILDRMLIRQWLRIVDLKLTIKRQLKIIDKQNKKIKELQKLIG